MTNLITTLIDRPSPLIFLSTGKLIYLKSLLTENRYLLSLIENTINRVLRKLYVPVRAEISVKQDVPKKWSIFPHIS